MPPKKREKDIDSTKNPRIDHIQADHELFLQAFEKPTQIYRYLRTRNMCSPIFLNRNLTYMKSRMSRSHKSRNGFKINSLLDKSTSRQKDFSTVPGYMNITFLGFYDKSIEPYIDAVQVETVLVKISHKKRKDSSSPLMEVSFGTAEVIANPLDQQLPNLAPTDTTTLITNLENLTLSPNSSEDNLFKSDWLRARDSLENLLTTRCNKYEIVNSKSTHFPSTEKVMLNESPCSESQIGSSKTMNSVSKVLAWDPWDKLGRKNKKENKRRKYEKTPADPNLSAHSNKDHTSGDEIRNDDTSGNIDNVNNIESDGFIQNYEYQPYHPKNVKTVEFTNEVMVVYITGDEVVGESTEPLKKELEQQIRNKEMRRGHCLTTLFGKRKIEDDYMSAWLKK